MSGKRSDLGKRGEQIAASYLADQGYDILHRNYRLKSGELDIIARKGDTLVFCEVKTRSSLAFGSPAHAVTTRKQIQISRVAQEYLCRSKVSEVSARFDVISVLLTSGADAEIEHIPNAFDLNPAF